MTDEKLPRGRPAFPEDERMIQRSIRLKKATWAKIETYGLPWARSVLDRARPPASAGAETKQPTPADVTKKPETER